METEANEENEVKLSPPGVKSAQRTFVAFAISRRACARAKRVAIFCARMSLAGYQVRGFHAIPARWQEIGHDLGESDHLRPNQTKSNRKEEVQSSKTSQTQSTKGLWRL